MTPPSSASGSRRLRIIFNTLAAAYLTLLVAPWRFAMPQSGIDWSYHAAIAHAYLAGWEWGRDVILTFGPLGFLYFRLFLDGTLLITVVFWSLVTAALAINFLDLVRPVPLAWSAFLLLGFALPFSFERVEPVFFVLPLLAAIGAFRRPRPVALWKTLALAVIAGAAALIKLPFGVLSASIFVLLDLHRMSRRGWPVYTPAFLTAGLAAYVATGQPLSRLPEFLAHSVEAVSGYTESMQYWGPPAEVGLFLAAGAAAVWLWIALAADPPPDGGRWRAGLLVASFALFLFMIFKAGFVRHDVHSVTSWDALSAAVAAYLASVWHPKASAKALACGIGVIVGSCGYSIRVQADHGFPNVWQRVVAGPLGEITSASRFAVDAEGWRRHLRHRRDVALAAVRDSTPLVALDGSVDTVPSIQASVLAHGMAYQPRPTVQEYTAYTDGLIDANLAFIRSDRAPMYVIHGAGSIDGRYPSLADGPLWPDLLRLYEPAGVEGGSYLRLRRRPAPLGRVLSEPLEMAASLGEETALPVRGPAFVRIQLGQTAFGRLAELLFKPGQVWLTVTLVNGTTRRHLLTPGIASRGFLLSPLVEDAATLSAFWTGSSPGYANSLVRAFRVDPDRLAGVAYRPAMTIEVWPVSPRAD